MIFCVPHILIKFPWGNISGFYPYTGFHFVVVQESKKTSFNLEFCTLKNILNNSSYNKETQSRVVDTTLHIKSGPQIDEEVPPVAPEATHKEGRNSSNTNCQLIRCKASILNLAEQIDRIVCKL